MDDTSKQPTPFADGQPTLNSSFFDIVQSRSEMQVDFGTADTAWLCVGVDGCRYVIKDGTSKQSTAIVPHCEWFCSKLSEAVQIAAPLPKIVRRLDGTLVFGSRFLGGLINADDPAGFWYDRVKSGEIPLAEISNTLSHIYAFDHFVNNHDRHRWNFLVQKTGDFHSVIAMDYSRAWLRVGFPLPPMPMNPSNTVSHQKWLRNFWGIDYLSLPEIELTLNEIRKVTKEKIVRIIEDHPAEWLPESQKKDILEWWGQPAFFARIDSIVEGVKNGSCF